MTASNKTALVLAFDGIEEIEALAPVDILRRAGITVTIASLDGAPTVTGRNAITFAVDSSLEKLASSDFDLVFLPGGPGVLKLLDHAKLGSLLCAQADSGKLLAAICAAPKVLAVNGILDSKTATSHSSVRADLPTPSDAPIVVYENIITSQGLGTAVEFALKLVELLVDSKTVSDIATSIHHQS